MQAMPITEIESSLLGHMATLDDIDAQLADMLVNLDRLTEQYKALDPETVGVERLHRDVLHALRLLFRSHELLQTFNHQQHFVAQFALMRERSR